jgi:DNA gyrase inhibitor GyrI
MHGAAFRQERRSSMRKSLFTALAAVGTTAIGGAIVYYLREKATPGPEYRTLRSEGELEIRDYPAIVVAETVVQGPRKAALEQGFRMLAVDIFAKSRAGEKLPMTVPVLQGAGDPMASDPPLFDDELEGAWRVRFVMPSGKAPDELPAPPEGVELIDLPARRVASATFGGIASDQALTKAEDRLRGWLQRLGEVPASEPEYAFYNSPMIPPPLRRNEVLIPLN